MATLYEAIRDTVFSKWALFAVITVVVLCVAAVYVTKKFIMPSIKPSYAENNEFVEKRQTEPVMDVVLYYTAWCPHSKSAMATWLDMKKTYDGSISNGVKVRMEEVDCDQEPDTAESANVEEYPTIIATYHGKNYTLDSKPTTENITALVNSVTK
jgi:thiol-disulfide isomerase/thioredoxin